MEVFYQTADFALAKLGELSVERFAELIAAKDWTADLMMFASLSASPDEVVCPPAFHAQIEERLAFELVPHAMDRYTIAASKGTGFKWLQTGKEFRVVDIGLDEVISILQGLERGEFDELRRHYRKKPL